MRGPQKFANKWLSTVLHIIGSNAKGGIWAKRGTAEDDRQFEESWAAADEVTWLDQSAEWGRDIGEKPKADMPTSLMNLTEFAVGSIRDVSGVNMEMLGARDANQPGVLEYQRRQAAMTTLAEYFDALRFYRKQQGRVLLYFLREHIAPTGRLVKIVEDDKARYVPLAMSDDAETYDVIVEEAPQAPNQKERNWEIVQSMLPMVADQLTLEDWVTILENSPMPSTLVDHFREKLEKSNKEGAQPDPAEQLQMAKLKAEVRETNANAALDETKALVERLEAQLSPRKLASEVSYNEQRAASEQAQAQARQVDALTSAMSADRKADAEDVKAETGLFREMLKAQLPEKGEK